MATLSSSLLLDSATLYALELQFSAHSVTESKQSLSAYQVPVGQSSGKATQSSSQCRARENNGPCTSSRRLDLICNLLLGRRNDGSYKKRQCTASAESARLYLVQRSHLNVDLSWMVLNLDSICLWIWAMSESNLLLTYWLKLQWRQLTKMHFSS